MEHIDSEGKLRKGSPLKFYSRFLFQRTCDFNVLLSSGRRFQQYFFEMFVKAESERLSWPRHNQSKSRASDYTHLCELLADAVTNKNEINEWTGNNNHDHDLNVGRLVVLPSNHIGSNIYMRQKMNDILAISNAVSHPDVFITMTCNPYWSEVQSELIRGQKAVDRPDLCNRVFRMKLKLLLKHRKENEPFGKVISFVSAIEFQKRDFVLDHIIIFLDQEAKFYIQELTNVDKVISRLYFLATCFPQLVVFPGSSTTAYFRVVGSPYRM